MREPLCAMEVRMLGLRAAVSEASKGWRFVYAVEMLSGG